jgi:hypothetical protein
MASQLRGELRELDVGLAVKAITVAATPADRDAGGARPAAPVASGRASDQREVTPMKLRVHAHVAATALAALLAAFVAACANAPAISTTTPSPTVTAGTTAGSCHAREAAPYVLPDPACTPGATNPEVLQASIGSTICRRGWTRTVRPPESYTEELKRQQMRDYSWTGPLNGWEEDHLVPLEVGGAPSDPRNLWPEPGASPNPKDRVESAANRAVCEGRMPLADAQRAIAADWVAFGRQLGVVG